MSKIIDVESKFRDKQERNKMVRDLKEDHRVLEMQEVDKAAKYFKRSTLVDNSLELIILGLAAGTYFAMMWRLLV
jgi:hypothetical protein